MAHAIGYSDLTICNSIRLPASPTDSWRIEVVSHARSREISLMKRTRVQSRQDYVRYAAPLLARSCPSDPDCRWRRFDSWNCVDLVDKRSRPVTPPPDGDPLRREPA